MNVLSCTRLTKRFGSTVAVSELDLGVPAGQVYGFLGPNGAGKTAGGDQAYVQVRTPASTL
jgi:ABC-2 type transport system ATP-binding protein